MVRIKQTMQIPPLEWVWLPDGHFPHGTGELRLVHVSTLRRFLKPAPKRRRIDYLPASSSSSSSASSSSATSPTVRKAIAKGRRRLLARSSSSSSAASADSGGFDEQLDRVRKERAQVYFRHRYMLKEIAERKRIAAIDASNLRAFVSALARVRRALERYRKQEERQKAEEERKQVELDADFEAACGRLDAVGEELAAAALPAREPSDEYAFMPRREASDEFKAMHAREPSDTTMALLSEAKSYSSETLKAFRFV